MRSLRSLLIALLACAPAALHAQSEITLISPGSIQPSMEQLIASYEAKTGRKVKATFASGGITRQQIIRGEAFDVMILQPPYPEVLASGNVAENTATALATVALGMAGRKGAPKPDISTPDAVKRTLLSAKGVAYPDEPGGASGIAFMKMLDKLGIAEQMQPKLKHGHNGTATMDFVLSGEADYGVTFMSGLNRAGLEAIGPMPKELVPPTGYVGFLSAHTKDAASGKALLDYLSSSEAAQAWTSRGFVQGR
jgi:molybdate transport system substrate-binding protein